MKKKQICLLLLIPIIIIGYLFVSNMQKENWLKETPEIKYSEDREKEVWGKILRGTNPALYYGTPFYKLADAMSGLPYFRNEEKIEKLIDEVPKEYINFQEQKFGTTIGHFALKTLNYNAIRRLLDKGLNPNLMDKSGDALIITINSSGYSYKSPENLKTLKYMIQKGANVNLYSQKAQSPTPLIAASKSGDLNHLINLINAGANPHFTFDYDLGPTMDKTLDSALRQALLYGRIQVVNYLIFNQKVDFRNLKNPKKSKFHPDDYIILYNLREMFFNLDSKEYQEKMKLVAYLKLQGLDYWKTPIQERYIKNPNYTKEYLSKY